MTDRQANGIDPLIMAAVVVSVIVGGIVLWLLDNNQTDNEQQNAIPLEEVTNFEECMSGLYNWEEIDGVTYCYGPNDTTYTGES